MHFLEEHVVPWVKKWKIGFGLMGEQGAESVHAYFNGLVPDPVKRMECTMREHLLHIAPANVAAKPQLKKRKMNSGRVTTYWSLFSFCALCPVSAMLEKIVEILHLLRECVT